MNNFIVPQRGHSPIRLLLYLFGPGRANEHVDQRVIAADETLGIADGTRLDIADGGDRAEILALGAQMDAHRRALGVQMPGGHVWHCAISLPPGERLTDEQWAQAARAAVAAMGFDTSSGKAPCRWIAVHHGPSKGGNDHLHLAVNLVREDGTFATTWRDRKTMSRVCAELERRFGLSVVQGRAGAGMPGLSRAEIERHERAVRTERACGRESGATEPERIRLARIVRGCATTAADEADFVRRLRRAQVMVRPRYAPGGRDRVVGYSVALRDAGEGRVWFGGGRLARDLTLTRLREHWQASPQLEAEAVAEWSRRGGSVPPSAMYRANSWEQAAAVVDQVRRQLAEVDPGDGAVWAGVAREAAGLLAVWSMRLETRRPGPLAAAADLLARSAQTPVGAPRARRAGRVRDLRGVAMVAAAASTASDSVRGQMLLVRQIIRLMDAVAEMHRARGQAGQAAALAAAAHDGLARIQMRRAAARPSPSLGAPRGTGSPPRLPGRGPDRDIGR